MNTFFLGHPFNDFKSNDDQSIIVNIWFGKWVKMHSASLAKAEQLWKPSEHTV